MEIASDIYLRNHKVLASESFDPGFLLKGTNVYEVLRVIEGIPLFLEDHFLRFSVSIQKQMPDTSVSLSLFNEQIIFFIRTSCLRFGNIKVVFHADEHGSDLFIYQIPHFYPDPSMYKMGVTSMTIEMTRPDPNYKNWRPGFKEKIANLKKDSNVYEVLLSNTQGYITEGSQSNFFIISGETVCTPPSELILPGITRQKVLAILLASGITLREMNIESNLLHTYSSAFISGTSPKILPLSKINNITFDVSNKILRHIMSNYDEMIREYIQKKV